MAASKYFDIEDVAQQTGINYDTLIEVASILGFQIQDDRIGNEALFLGGLVPDSFLDYLRGLQENAAHANRSITEYALYLSREHEKAVRAAKDPAFDFQQFFLKNYGVRPEDVPPGSILHDVLEVFNRVVLPLAGRTAALASVAFVDQTLNYLQGMERNTYIQDGGGQSFLDQTRQAIADRLEFAAKGLLPVSLPSLTNSLQEAKSLPTLPEGRQNLEQA